MKAKIIIEYDGDFTEENIKEEVSLIEDEINNSDDETSKFDNFKVSYEIIKEDIKPNNLKFQIREFLIKRDKLQILTPYDDIFNFIKGNKKEIEEDIKQLLEDGEIYEPKPKFLRWLG